MLRGLACSNPDGQERQPPCTYWCGDERRRVPRCLEKVCTFVGCSLRTTEYFCRKNVVETGRSDGIRLYSVVCSPNYDTGNDSLCSLQVDSSKEVSEMGSRVDFTNSRPSLHIPYTWTLSLARVTGTDVLS
jgi:hypothetical protein